MHEYKNLYIPAVCVAVAVDVTLTGAAGGRTLQHVLMHGQNYGAENTHTQGQRVQSRRFKTLFSCIVCKYLGWGEGLRLIIYIY